MRKSVMGLIVATMLIIGVSSATCRAQGPFPPQFPPMAVK